MTDHEAYYDGWWCMKCKHNKEKPSLRCLACMKDPFVSFTSSPINYEDGEKMYG